MNTHSAYKLSLINTNREVVLSSYYQTIACGIHRTKRLISKACVQLQRGSMEKKSPLLLVLLVLLLPACNGKALPEYQHSASWVRLGPRLVADLLAEINPIRITFHQTVWAGAMQQKFQFTPASVKTEINTPAQGSGALPVSSESINISTKDKARKSNKLNQTLSQNQDLLTYLLVAMVVLILFVLIVLAFIYFKRSRFSLQHNSGISDPESIRYDSKMSLCSLIFDELDSVLYVSYGKKHSRFGFAQITGFEVIVNTHCLMKIDRNDVNIFDVKAEENLAFLLNDIEKEKLQENETRQIALNIFCESETEIDTVLVNFYYREGDHRLSQHSFARSMDDVVFWCDLLESAIRPVANEALETLLDTEKDVTESLTILNQSNSEINPRSEATQRIQNNHDLADELTRLADLKTKGFLSEEEFQKAKDKIIN